MMRKRNNHYSQELKTEAVQAYQNGEESYVTVCKKYGLRSKTQLVKCYNGHKEVSCFVLNSSKHTCVKVCLALDRCIDNEPMEGFNLKCIFTSMNELIIRIQNYMVFYNTKRYQKRLYCMTPMECHYTFVA